MAGLETLTGNDPQGGETPQLGDDRIRELAQKTKTSFAEEHALSGEHKFPRGTTAQRPAAGNGGRFYILENSGVERELQFDDGDTWITITKNQQVVDSLVSDHNALNPIDHPDSSITTPKYADESVTANKIGSGEILRRHLHADDANPSGSLKNLIDGSEIDDTWHTHAAGGGGGSPVFLDNKVTITFGSASPVSPSYSYTTGWNSSSDLTGNGIPSTATAVILEIETTITPYTQVTEGETVFDTTFSIQVRKNSSSIELAAFDVNVPASWESTGNRFVQVICPINSNYKVQYKVEVGGMGTATWKIKAIGYF